MKPYRPWKNAKAPFSPLILGINQSCKKRLKSKLIVFASKPCKANTAIQATTKISDNTKNAVAGPLRVFFIEEVSFFNINILY